VVDLADGAVLDELVGLVVERIVGTLVADLEVAPGAACRLDHPLALLDRVGHGLLDQHVLARLEGVDGDLRVRPQRHRDQHGVDILALEQLPVVGVPLGVRIVQALRDVEPLLEVRGIDVADGNEPDEVRVAVLHQHPSLSAGPDDAGPKRPQRRGLPEEHPGRRQRRGRLDEVPAADLPLLFRHGLSVGAGGTVGLPGI
jgi:hypothetical protein